MMVALMGEAVNKLVPLLTMHFAAVRLGAAGFGISQFAMWLLEWAILFVSFGYPQSAPVAVRRAASDDEKRQIAGALILNRLVHAGLAFTILFAAASLNDDWAIYRPAVLASGFIIFLSAFDMSGILIGVQKLGAYSMVTILAKLGSLLAVWALIQSPRDSGIYVAITNGANGAICIGSLILALIFTGVGAPTLDQMRNVWRISAPFALSVLALLLVERFDLYLVERAMGPEGAGWYSGPAKLMQSIVPLIATISTVFYSEMAGTHDDTSLRRHLRFSLMTVFMFVLPIIAGTWFTGGEFLALVFGPGFEQQASTLNILVVNALAHALILVIGFQTLGLRHRMRPVYVALGIGLVCGILAGDAMSRDLGYMGVAIASAASRCLAAAIIVGVALRLGLVHLRELVEPLWKAGAPALGMSLVLFSLDLAGGLPLGAIVAAGVAGYAAFFILVNRDDAERLWRSVKQFALG